MCVGWGEGEGESGQGAVKQAFLYMAKSFLLWSWFQLKKSICFRVAKQGKRIRGKFLPALVKGNNLDYLQPLTQCILVDSSTVICWMNPIVILGVSGQFCLFYSSFGGKSC